MQGAIESLVSRSVQLMKRAKGEPEYTLTGGILRFETMANSVRTQLGSEVNMPESGDGSICCGPWLSDPRAASFKKTANRNIGGFD